MMDRRSAKTRMRDKGEWRARIISYAVLLCVLLSLGSCGIEKKENPPSSQAAAELATAAQQTIASSNVGSTDPSPGETTTEAGHQSFGFRDVLHRFFDGKLIGTRGESGLVEDYEHDYFDAVQEAFEILELPVNLHRDLVYPQVTFDTEDGRMFNELVQHEVKMTAKSWSDMLGLDNSMLLQYREDMLENGFVYEDYGVIETERYLSIIRLHAYTMNDHEHPDFEMETYVFDKKTGNLLRDLDIIHLAADGKNGVYEAVQDFYSDIAMNRSDLDPTVFSYYNTAYLREYFDARAGAKKISGEEGYFFGGITSYYVDAKGEPRMLVNFRTHYPDVRFTPLPEHRNLYTWYADSVADVSLSALGGEKKKQEYELFGILMEEFELSDDATALIAYIGEGDVMTAYILQEFVDQYHLDIGDFEMAYGIDWISEENYNEMPQSVYLLIPKYVNTLSWIDIHDARGMTVLALRQDEGHPATISVNDGDHLIELRLPVRYDKSFDDLSESGIIDFTKRFAPCTVSPSEIDVLEFRQEIEDFLFPIRIYG